MQEYEELEIEMIAFDVEDVITASDYPHSSDGDIVTPGIPIP